jgi:uncharacterized protein YrrD
MDDLGAPISYLVLGDGAPVYDRDGELVGVVDHTLVDEETGIFEGVIVHTRPVVPGRHVFASHDQIAELRERGVVLAVGRDDLHELDASAARRRDAKGGPESPIEATLRKAWDWLSGVR